MDDTDAPSALQPLKNPREESWTSMTAIDRLLAVAPILLLTATIASPEVSQPVVRFLTPDGSSPAIGEVDVVVEVESSDPVVEVALHVDGLPAGRRAEAPFVFPISLGEENTSHRFVAEAVTASGARGRASLVTPPYRVDEVVDLELQQVYVTVTDRRGRRVPGLEKADFRLLDSGREQKIVTFAGGDIPFSAVLLIDGSQSMKGAQMEAARAGARAFFGGMGEFDEAKVIIFSTRLLATSEFSGRGLPVDRMLAEVVPAGGSAINDFVFLALRRLERRSGRRVVVLLSDGWDVHSVLQMEQVGETGRQSQAQIYWLRLRERRSGDASLVNSWRDPRSNQQQMRLLEKTIRESGGRIIDVSSATEIRPAFREVLDELRDQYALGYYPDPRFDDGRWRRLEIEVSNRYRATSREGYLDLP